MNVVLICLDTFRADCVAAAGLNPDIKTPSLNRLAREGVLFENAFAEGLPTIQYRRALCTGRRSFPFKHDFDTTGVWPTGAGWHKVPPEQKTMAEILLGYGFCTGLVADTYHMFKPTMNFTRGMAAWEFVRGQESDNWRIGSVRDVDLSKYRPPDSQEVNPLLLQYLLNMRGRKGEADYLPARVFSSAIRWLGDHRDCRPFFLWIDSFDPHEPWDPPKKYANLYDPDWNEGWEPIHGALPGASEQVQRRMKALYYGECTFVDKQIGRLLDKLEETGLADETLVLVTSDHGTELWDHGGLHKGVNACRYRHTSGVVAIMRLPGKAYAGTRVSGLIQNHDFLPTILNLMGIPSGEVDGLDFMPLVYEQQESIRECAITGMSRIACVRTLDYSWSCDYTSPDPREMLFDLRSDPGEMVNVAADHRAVCADYRARLEDYLGQKLPLAPRPKVEAYPMPAAVWAKKAPWAQGLK